MASAFGWRLPIRSQESLQSAKTMADRWDFSMHRRARPLIALDTPENLPLIVEIVDSAEQIKALLPELDRIVQRGMITLTPVEIVYDGKIP